MKRLGSILVLLCLLAACQPHTDVLPTAMDINAISTNDAATATTGAVSVAATRVADSATQTAVAVAHQPTPLPPTWTPLPTATDVPIVAISAPASSTPVGAKGTIYYIFNGDSIAALKADASNEQLILVGGAPAELTLSPDNKFLAYTAQGNGSAREVFITTLDGTYVQQVSCLGFARVTALGWSPDSQTIAFAGSQTSDGPLGIYTAGVIGSGQCPTGNNQRLLTQTTLNEASHMTWSNDGSQVFFSSGVMYGYDLTNNLFYPPLTTASGYGPDSSSAYRPGSDELYYLKSYFDSNTNTKGGTVYHISTRGIATFPIPGIKGVPVSAVNISFSRDGRYLLATSDRNVYMQDLLAGSASPIITGSNFFPEAVFSPDADWVAYVDGKPGAITIQEIFITTKDGQTKRQISAHQDGTISDLNWGE